VLVPVRMSNAVASGVHCSPGVNAGTVLNHHSPQTPCPQQHLQPVGSHMFTVLQSSNGNDAGSPRARALRFPPPSPSPMELPVSAALPHDHAALCRLIWHIGSPITGRRVYVLGS
jgi:hypothetical protein